MRDSNLFEQFPRGLFVAGKGGGDGLLQQS
jgi:hypothetical protein